MEVETINYRQRRVELFEQLNNTIAIIPAGTHKTRSNDTQYNFRQDSNYKYYTGINESDGILLLLKNKNGEARSIIFTLKKDPLKEQWDGLRLGREKALNISECDESYELEEFENIFKSNLPHYKNIAFDLNNFDLFNKLQVILNTEWSKTRGRTCPASIIHLAPLTGRQRLVKNAEEIKSIKKAVELTERAFLMSMALATPGKNESEINTMINFIFNQNNGNGPAYTNIVAGGENALILHYIENNMPLNDQQLLLIDAGAEYNNYASDVTRTFPINGKFNSIQNEVYTAVLDSQKNALSHCTSGKTLTEVHMASSRVLADFLISHKILSGSVDEVIETQKIKKYYPHGTSHWLGLDVHDPCPYRDEENETLLAENMLFTVEPGLYFPTDDQSVPQEFRGIGIRIEDDILITDKGHQNLTISIPKEIKEIEAACTEDYSKFLF